MAVLLGLSLFMSATVLAGSQQDASAQADLDTTMLLFDLSGSMGELEPDGRTRLAVAQKAMVDALGGLAPGSKNIGIRSFSNCGVTRLEHAPAPVDQASLTATIGSFAPVGRTDISVALNAVVSDFGVGNGRNSVILLSDGVHNCAGDPCDTAGDLIAAGIDIIVHAIGIGTAGTSAESQLGCIATVTGGTVVSVDGADELFDAIDAVITGGATSASIQAAIPTCANSPLVQADDSLATATIGSSFRDSAGILRLLIVGQACGFGCSGGFDVNCDGKIGDFCNSDFDLTVVSGVGKCVDALELNSDTDQPDSDGPLRNLDALLQRYCVDISASFDGDFVLAPALVDPCDHYAEAQTFQRRADAARDNGDAFLKDFNQALADEALDQAKGELASAIVAVESEGAEYVTALASVTGDWSDVPGGDPADWNDDELRLMLETIDINFDLDTIALKTAAGVPELLDATPDWLKADLFTAGFEVQLTANVAGATFPPANYGLLSPATISGNVSVSVATKLTEPQAGIGFTNTQKFEVTAETRATARGTLGKPKLLSLYARLDKLGKTVGLQTPLKELLERSRFLRWVNKIPVSLAYERFVGAQMRWETTVSEAQAARGANGLPNIYDPGTFEVGNSVLIRGGEINGSLFSAKFKALGVPWFVEGELVEFEGLGWGVTRLDQNRFAVFSGPIEAVESQVLAGIKFGVVIGLVGTKDLSFADYRYAELDMRTQGGQDAYIGFAQGLGVPVEDSAGVRTATFEEITFEQELGFKVDLGFYQATGTSSRNEAVHTTANFADGTRETNVVYTYPGAQVDLLAPLLPDGRPNADDVVATFLIADVSDDRGSVSSLATAFGAPLPAGDRFDVQITMTGADIREFMVRSQALMDELGIEPVEDPLNDILASFTTKIGSASDVEEAIYVFTQQLVQPVNLVTLLGEGGIDVSYPDTLGGQLEFRVTG